jgi:hypothetical protein
MNQMGWCWRKKLMEVRVVFPAAQILAKNTYNIANSYFKKLD